MQPRTAVEIVVVVVHRCDHVAAYALHPATTPAEAERTQRSESKRLCAACVRPAAVDAAVGVYVNRAGQYRDGFDAGSGSA